MISVLFVDGMHCMYDEAFSVNKELLSLLESYHLQKIIVVNGFEKRARAALQKKFEIFSLEEEGIKKNTLEYWKRVLSYYHLKAHEVLYFDHDKNNVETAQSIGIHALQYTKDIKKIKTFLEKYLE